MHLRMMLLIDINILGIGSLWHRLLLLLLHNLEIIWSHLEQEIVVRIKVFFVNFAYLSSVVLLSILTLNAVLIGGDTPTIQKHRWRIQIIIIGDVRVVRPSYWGSVFRGKNLIIIRLKEVLIND